MLWGGFRVQVVVDDEFRNSQIRPQDFHQLGLLILWELAHFLDKMDDIFDLLAFQNRLLVKNRRNRVIIGSAPGLRMPGGQKIQEENLGLLTDIRTFAFLKIPENPKDLLHQAPAPPQTVPAPANTTTSAQPEDGGGP